MRKLIVVLGAVILASVFASCGSTKQPSAASLAAEKEGIPAWCYEGSYKDKDGYYATGVSTVSNKALAMQTARLNARGELARLLGDTVMASAKQKMTEAEAEKANSDINDVATQVLVGSRQVDFFKNENDGITYVRVFMPFEDVLKEFKGISTKNSELNAVLHEITIEQLKSTTVKASD